MGWPLARAAVSLVILFPVACAEVRLAGRVTDETGTPLSGVRLVLHSADTSLETITGPTGAYAFPSVDRPGDYFLDASLENYFEIRNQIVHLGGGASEIALILNPVREVFESVDVHASPQQINLDTTQSEQSLSSTEIVDLPYPTTHSLRRALRLMPGMVQDSAGGLHVSGGAENQLLYTIDGFTINDPLSATFQTRLSVEAVQSVDLSTGLLPAEWGKGSAGTLALKSRAGDDRIRYSATNFVPGIANHKGLTFSDWIPRLTVSGPIRKQRAWFSDSLDLEYITNFVNELPKGQDRTPSLRINNLLHAQFNLTAANILSAGYLINNWDAPHNGLGVLDPLSTTVDRRTRQNFIYVKDQIYFHRGALVEFGFAGSRTFERQIPQGHDLYILTPEGRQGNYFLDSTSHGGRDQWIVNVFLPSFEWLGHHQFKTGADVDRLTYQQDARRSSYEYFRQNGALLSRVTFGGSGVFGESNTEGSSYFQDSWKPARHWLVEAGVRQDWDHLVHHIAFSPRAGVAWTPGQSGHTKITAGYTVLHDATNLRVFARPLDQYTVTTVYNPDGSVLYGPSITLFTRGGAPLRMPRYRNQLIGLDQLLPHGILCRVSYLRRRGRDGFTYTATAAPGVLALDHDRHDAYDAVNVTARQTFGREYEWLVSYARSRAFSNAVVDLSVDEPTRIYNNLGRMPWDAPNHLLSWAYLPTPWRNWAIAYLLETRTGFPFSVQNDQGQVIGDLNSHRYPDFFELDLHIERRFTFRGHRWALRAGFNNITAHKNPNTVVNTLGAPNYLTFYGGQGRTLNFRIRWLGKAEKTN